MQRTKTLTTKHVKAYNIGLLVLMCVSILVIVFSIISDRISSTLFIVTVPMIYPMIIQIRTMRRIKHVEYDDTNLYVFHNDYQIQIPFEDVREVNLETGGYVFKLYKKTQVGKEVLCLPSIWYPFNYKKVDAEMNRVREMIAKRKREVYKNSGDAAHQLSSLNL